MLILKKIITIISTVLLIVSCSEDSSNKDFIPSPFEEGLSGTDIGNGGDLVSCSSFRGSHHSGYEWYVLDYVELRNIKTDPFKFDATYKYIDHVRQLIKSNTPEFLEYFEHYIQSIPFYSDVNSTYGNDTVAREWIETEKNIEINDEDPIYIPSNCREPGSNKIKLHQVIVRNELFNSKGDLIKVIYNYDSQLIKKIGDDSLQLSMLIIHEWLWDFYSRKGFLAIEQPNALSHSRRLRSANRSFHSRSSKFFRSEDIRRLLGLI